jgi:hypothetical protein
MHPPSITNGYQTHGGLNGNRILSAAAEQRTFDAIPPELQEQPNLFTRNSALPWMEMTAEPGIQGLNISRPWDHEIATRYYETQLTHIPYLCKFIDFTNAP